MRERPGSDHSLYPISPMVGKTLNSGAFSENSTSIGREKSIEASLIRYRNSGDPKIATMLFQQYWHLVLGSCMKVLRDRDAAQDAAMEIFERVLERLRVETPVHFPAWLFRVTRNQCLEILRKQYRLPHFEALEDVRLAADSDDDYVVTDTESQMLSKVVRNALATLPENQRVCVEMFYLQELSYREISDECGFSMMMVKSAIQNGKRRLSHLLAGVRGMRNSDQGAL